MRGCIITKERQLEVLDKTIADPENGEMFEDGFDTPESPVFLKDGGGEAWGIWRDDYLEGIFALGDLCRGGAGRFFP